MTLRKAEVLDDTIVMDDLQMILAVANLLLALGGILSGIYSWARGGVVAQFINNIGRIEKIEEDVDEINEWKDDTKSLLIALAIGNKEVNDRLAMEQVGIETDYKDLLDEKWKRENGNEADD